MTDLIQNLTGISKIFLNDKPHYIYVYIIERFNIAPCTSFYFALRYIDYIILNKYIYIFN